MTTVLETELTDKFEWKGGDLFVSVRDEATGVETKLKIRRRALFGSARQYGIDTADLSDRQVHYAFLIRLLKGAIKDINLNGGGEVEYMGLKFFLKKEGGIYCINRISITSDGFFPRRRMV